MRAYCSGRISRDRSPRRLAGLVLGMAIGLAGLQSSAGAATYTAADSAALTGYLNNPAVVRGDTIVLNAGTTYKAPSTGFILRAKSGSSGYVTIRSSNLSSLPPAGVRVTPVYAAHMPNIVSYGSNVPAIMTALPPEVAHHYRFEGIEVYNGGTQTELSNLIILGDYSSQQNSASVIAHNIIFDRCYIHGQGLQPNTLQMRRAIMLNSASTDIINCYISDVLSNAGQTACIGGWNGPGPYLIDNNFMSCSGENILFGGANGHVVGQTPTGITVTRNHFYKDPAWKGVWTRPCNHFELKCGKNVIIRDNLMENCWNGPDSQFGVAINLKCVQGSGNAGSSWFVTEDVTIENNLIRNVGLGVQIAGSVNPTGGQLFGQPRNITIRNNLFYNVDVNAQPGNKGWLFFMNNGSPNVTIDHNTGFATNMWMMPGDTNQPHNNFVYTNNITMKGLYGILGSGLSDGELSLSTYFPGAVFQKNVIMGSSFSAYDPNYLAGWNLPPFNNGNLVVPSSWSSVLVNQAAPGANFAGWKVVGWNQATNFSTYPYNNSGTDGKDIGCDIDALNAATAGCISGVWASEPPPAPTEVIVDNSAATLVGTWTPSTSSTGFYGANYLTDGNTGKGAKTATFTPNLVAGTYNVYARWTAYSNRASNVPFDITHAGGTSTTVQNQQINNNTWVLLGTYTFNSGSGGKVTIRTPGTNGHVIADAVKFTPASSEVIIDNLAATLTGTWFSSTNSPGYVGSDYLHDGNTAKGTKTARFTPNLTSAGIYKVYARWTAYSNRASNVPFDITHTSGTSTSVQNQQQNNNVWVLLGTYTFNTGTGGYVTIRTSGTNGSVIADAVRFVKQ